MVCSFWNCIRKGLSTGDINIKMRRLYDILRITDEASSSPFFVVLLVASVVQGSCCNAAPRGLFLHLDNLWSFIDHLESKWAGSLCCGSAFKTVWSKRASIFCCFFLCRNFRLPEFLWAQVTLIFKHVVCFLRAVLVQPADRRVATNVRENNRLSREFSLQFEDN